VPTARVPALGAVRGPPGGRLAARIGGLTVALAPFMLLLAACGGSTEATPKCEPALADAASITNLLSAYPELGNTLADGAQQVRYNRDAWAASSFRNVVAGRLQPSGEVGVWVMHYNDTNGALMGAVPVNDVAKAAAPESIVTNSDAGAAVRRVAESEEAAAAVACLGGSQ